MCLRALLIPLIPLLLLQMEKAIHAVNGVEPRSWTTERFFFDAKAAEEAAEAAQEELAR